MESMSTARSHGLNENEANLEWREKIVENYFKKLPQNVCLLDRLLGSGYEEGLWREETKITVTTDGRLNIDENLRQTLLGSFGAYVELLKQLGIQMVKIDGKFVKIHEIFSDDLTINDLKGKRAIVVKVRIFFFSSIGIDSPTTICICIDLSFLTSIYISAYVTFAYL